MGLAGLILGVWLGGCRETGTRTPEQLDAEEVQAQVPDTLLVLDAEIDQHPDSARLYALRSEVHYQLGDWPHTFEDIRQALRLDSLNPDFHYLLGFYHYGRQQDSTALRHLNRALELNTANPEVYYQIGNIHALRGQFREALDWYSQAIDRNDQQPIYHFAQAFVHHQLGNRQQALQSGRESLARDSAFVKSLGLMFDIYMEDPATYARARDYNTRILQVDPQHPVGLFNAGYYHFQTTTQVDNPKDRGEHMGRAMHYFTQAVENNPTYASAYYHRGLCRFDLEQFSPAMGDFEQTVKHNPQHFKAYFMMGRIYAQFDEPEKARRHWETTLEIAPGFGPARQALDQLAGQD